MGDFHDGQPGRVDQAQSVLAAAGFQIIGNIYFVHRFEVAVDRGAMDTQMFRDRSDGKILIGESIVDHGFDGFRDIIVT